MPDRILRLMIAAYQNNLNAGMAALGIYLPVFLFLLGIAFGSFLNVCIARLPLGESIIKPRSRCPACRTPIRAWDNIPLLSWFVLRRRCRACQSPISIQYPLVEFATGVWFVVAYFASLAQPELAPLYFIRTAVLGFLLLGLLVMDWQSGLLLDAFTFTGMGIGLLLCIIGTMQLPLDQSAVILTTPEKIVGLRLLAILCAALLLLAVRWIYKLARGREGMGLGDVKMLAMMAAFLGFPLTMLAFFLAIMAAALYAVVLVITRRARPASALPFGSFLALGGLYAALLGPWTIAWYLGFFPK